MPDDQPQPAAQNDEIVVTAKETPLPPRRGVTVGGVLGTVFRAAVNPGGLVQDVAAEATRLADRELSGTSRMSRIAAEGVASVDAARAREYDEQQPQTTTANSTLTGVLAGAARDMAVNRGISAATGGLSDVAFGIKDAIGELPEQSRRHLHAIETLSNADMPGFAYQEIPMGDRIVRVYIDATEAVGDPRENNIFDKITGADGLSDAQKAQIQQVRDQMAAQARQEIAEFEARHPEARSERQMQDSYERVLRGTLQDMQPITVPSALRTQESAFMQGEQTLEGLAEAYANAAYNEGDSVSQRDVENGIRRLEHRGILTAGQATQFQLLVDNKLEKLEEGGMRQNLTDLIAMHQGGEISREDMVASMANIMAEKDLPNESQILGDVLRDAGLNNIQADVIREAAAIEASAAGDTPATQRPQGAAPAVAAP